MTAEQPIVQPAWLEQRLADKRLRILDCTTYMVPQPVGASLIESGRPDYLAAHLPGAQHVDMVADLSDPSGRFPYTLPSPRSIEQLLGRLGIGNDDHLVLYARSSPVTVTRAWYVFFTMGHRRLSILDGGFARWQREGRPLTTELSSVVATRYTANFDPRRVVGLNEVRASLGSTRTLLVNALSPEQFAGSGGAHYGRPGRIPGSVCLPAREVADPITHAFAPLESLRGQYEAAGALGATRVIAYCGGGIAATAAAFALERLGHRDWAVYDNSLLEWANDPSLPMQSDADVDPK